MSASSSPLRPGMLIGGKWLIGERIGQGTYSEIYECYYMPKGAGESNSSDTVPIRAAAKIDHPSPRPGGLEWESNLLLKLQKYPFVPRHYGMYTGEDGHTKVLIMQLLGNNISTIRRRQPDAATLPFALAVNIILQMLAATECIHIEGYIHRDLKPSNFVHGNGRHRGHIYVLDFGQSRMYLDDRGNVRPARDKAGFRGTSLYSSLNAHSQADLGRRDDVWSLYYSFIDMVRGGLPWRPHKDDRKKCGIAKQYYFERPEELVEGLPGASHLLAIQHHLKALSFADKPDYAYIAHMFKLALEDASKADQTLAKSYPPYPSFPELIRLWNEATEADEEGEVFTIAESHTLGVGLKPSLAAVDRSIEDMELTILFDKSIVSFSCDCVLESRGGHWSHWYKDREGIPVYNCILVGDNGRPTDLANRVYQNLLSELEIYRSLEWANAAIDDTGVENEDSEEEEPGTAAATAGSGDAVSGETNVAGKKRRRPSDIDYATVSDAAAAKDVLRRVDTLYGLVKASDASTEVVTECVNVWTRIAEAALQAFAACTAADTVKEVVIDAMKRLLSFTDMQIGEELLSSAAAMVKDSKRFFLLSSIHAGDLWRSQLAVGKLEAWLAANGSKPPPLTLLTSLQSVTDDLKTAESEEKALRQNIRQRKLLLEQLIPAIDRERDIIRALTVDPASSGLKKSMASVGVTAAPAPSHTTSMFRPQIIGRQTSDATKSTAFEERDMEIE